MGKLPKPRSIPLAIGRYTVGLMYCLRAGQQRDVTRACSAVPVPEFCAAGVNRTTGRNVKVCYASCHHDACNWSRRTLHHMFDLLKRRDNRTAYWH